MTHRPAALLLALTLVACGVTGRTQSRTVAGVVINEDKPGLWKRATLPADSAIRIALARVPGGRITAAELEEEHGRLAYSFDLKVERSQGITEVLVDARSGEVVGVEREGEGAAPPPGGSSGRTGQ